MHGQKKRRKRSMEGSIAVDGVGLYWRLIAISGRRNMDIKGYAFPFVWKTASIENFLEYPFPKSSKGAPKLPQRPKFSVKTIEADVRQAMGAGWSRFSGKDFILQLPGISS